MGVFNILDAALDSPVQHAATRRQHLFATLIFAAVLVVVFYRAILFGEVLAPLDMLTKELPWRTALPADSHLDNPATADVMAIFHPWKHFVHSELKAGRFPLWCTHVCCGYPLAGAGDLKLFGLTTLFLWWCSPASAALLSFFAQLLIAMTGMYALLVSLRCRWLPAVLGGLVYGLNSAMFQHLEFEHIVGGLMMLPWICWALPRRRGSTLAGLFLGLAILNGSVQSLAMVWTSSVAFAVLTLRRRSVGAVGIMSVVGVAVGAVALLPNLELISHNTRARYEHVYWWEMIWKRPLAVLPWLASLVNPDALGNTQTFDLARALGRAGLAGNTASTTDLRTYAGLMAFLLAVLGLRVRHEVRTIGLWMMAVPVLMVVISPLYLIVYFRYFAAIAFGLTMLAALGLERVTAGDDALAGDIRKLLTVLGIAVALALTVGVFVGTRRAALTAKVLRAGEQGTSFYRADKEWIAEKARTTVDNFTLHGPATLRFAVLAVAAGCLLVFRRRETVLLCVVLNAGDLVELAWRTFPSTTARDEYPETPALRYLQQQTGLFRLSSIWNSEIEFPTARPNQLLPYKLDDARVYHSLVPENPLLAHQDWDGLNVRFFITPPRGAGPSVDWPCVYRGEVNIYENPRVRPRVEFAGGRVEIERYISGHIVVKVVAKQSGKLLVRERAYPGWVATVDAQRTAWREADGIWMSVPVSAGAHTVTLDYRPASVRWGLIITGLALIAVTLIVQTRRSSAVRKAHACSDG
jgi:hypothetical protein